MDKKNDTEQLILNAAEEEFLSKGFVGARTTSIAKAAGVTHAMLHYYFRTKEHLFERVLQEKVTLIGRIFLETLGNPELPLLERIERGMLAHFNLLAQNPKLPKFAVFEVFDKPDRVAMIIDRVTDFQSDLFEPLQRDIDDYAARGLCRRVDARMFALDVLSLNLMPFLARPVIEAAFCRDGLTFDEFVKLRNKENVETIMRKIKL